MTSDTKRWTAALAGGIALVDVVLVFWLRVRPQDGLADLELVQALVDHHSTVRWHLGLWPYQIATWSLMGTSAVMPIDRAEQLLMMIVLFVQVWGLSRLLATYGWPLVASLGVAAPVSIGFFFHAGFYEFTLGTGVAFLALAAARNDRIVRTVVLLVVCWFCHLLPYAVAAGSLTLEQLADQRVRSRTKVLRIGVLALPVLLFVVAAPKAQLDGGRYEPLRRAVKIAIADSFMATFDTTERVLQSTLAAALLSWLVVMAWRRYRRGDGVAVHGPMALGAIVIALGGVFAPPSVFNGTFLWQRFGLYAWVFALAALGPVIRMADDRAHRVVGVGGLVLMVALTVHRVPTYRQIDRELDDIASIGRLLEADDIVAGLHGGMLHPYAQAYPTAHAESIAARRSGADYLSNIVTHSGIAIGTYPKGVSAAWGYPEEGYHSLAIVPTVIVTMGPVDPAVRQRLHDEGFVESGTTDGGLATAWREPTVRTEVDPDADANRHD